MTTDGGRYSLTRVGTRKFERYLVRIVAVFGVLYGAQNGDSLSAQWLSTTDDPLGVTVTVLALASVVIGLVPAVAPDRAGFAFRAALGTYAIALLVWPFSIDSPVTSSPMPWFVAMWPVVVAYLAVVSTGTLVPLLISLGSALYVSVILFVVGHLELGDVFSNGFFMAAASGVLLLLVRSVRQGVARADAAQDAALSDYGQSRFDDAAEAERVRTDALVHDSVITTFLAAAEARTSDAEVLSRRMAANAIRVLRHVNRTADMGPGVPFRIALGNASEELALLLPHFHIQPEAVADLALPIAVNDALIGAMAEAMANSLAHAATATHRTIELSALGADGIRIVIFDDGDGFRVPEATEAGLGIRVSIIERLRRVDGRADVRSRPGLGTAVTLSWGSVVISGTAPLYEELGAVPA